MSDDQEGRIARGVHLTQVISLLAQERPIFHSEADFQFALAWLIKQLRPELSVRLEVRQGSRREYLDLLLRDPDGHATAIELKYFTSTWTGTDPATGESFDLRAHAADDLLRLHFVHDVTRLERTVRQPGFDGNGFAILLTNHAAFWKPTRSRSRQPRDTAFRLHEGALLTGDLTWGVGDYPANNRRLAGAYESRWNDYSDVGGLGGAFRWLAFEVS